MSWVNDGPALSGRSWVGHARRLVKARGALAALALGCGLAACGGSGGGGGGDSAKGGSAFQLSFLPGTLTATYYQGEPSLVGVQVRANQAHSAPVQVAVIDSAGVTDGNLQLLALSSLTYEATLRLSPTLPAGNYTGNLEVRVCEDLPTTCARPVPGSPWRLPYQVQVRPQSDLRPLSTIPGVAGWPSAAGGGNGNALRAFDSTAAQFSRRWHANLLDTAAAEGPPVVEGGYVLTVSRVLSGGVPTLVARREADGSVAWSRALGSLNDNTDRTPTVVQGQVFLMGSDGNRTAVWRLDLATGAVLSERSFPRASGAQAGAVYLDGYLYSCRRVLGTESGLTRFSVSSLDAEVAEVGAGFSPECQASTDGQRVYRFTGERLLAMQPGNTTPVLNTAVNSPYPGLPAPVVLDGAGKAYVAQYTYASDLDGTSRLMAFDTTTGLLLWQLQGGFKSAPVVSGNVLYVINGRRLEARSTTQGDLLWGVDGTSPSGLAGFDSAVVATATHVFLGSLWVTDAIDVATRGVVWSDNSGGPMAISAQGVLVWQRSFNAGPRTINLR
jgi:hypothetical protein